MDGKCVRRGRAFRAGILSARKGEAVVASPAARPDRPHLTAAPGAPEKQARIVRARSNTNSNSNSNSEAQRQRQRREIAALRF